MSHNMDPPPGVNPKFSSLYYNKGSSFAPPTQSAAVKADYQHKKGIPAGGWDTEEAEEIKGPQSKYQTPSTSVPVPRPQQVVVKPTVEKPSATLNVSTEPGQYERKLVQDITHPGGARLRPSDKDLNEFSGKCKYLDSSVVCHLLFEVLQDPTRSLKALYVLEKLATSYEPYIALLREHDYWRSCTNTANHVKVVNAISQRVGGSSQPELLIQEQSRSADIALLPDLDIQVDARAYSSPQVSYMQQFSDPRRPF
mmetsp:Transcript_28067/g.50274  ORF Transcript_28067/g.50274 Transcript_28067/m.50274 type:complete len:254 (-) Transcript_28067:27-788(-)